MAEYMRPVMVAQMDDMPDYITASIACHELSHRWAEQNVRAYTVDKIKWKRYRISQEPRRHGLTVKRITSKEGKIKDDGISSDYLNELATNCTQKDFIDSALHDNVDTFVEEKQGREAFLQGFVGSSDGVLVPCTLTDDASGTTSHIFFPREDIYFDTQGVPLYERGSQFIL